MTRPKIALYSARRLNKGWGYGNRVYAALGRLGWEMVADVDYRLEGIEKGLGLPPDTVHLILKGELFTPEVLSRMKGKKILWYPDQVNGFPDRRNWMTRCAKLFDLVCVSHLDEMGFYQGIVAPEKLLFLPVGFCPIAHVNPNPSVARTVAIGFAGSIDKHRQEYLNVFEAAGLPISVRKVFGTDLQAFYGQCKIVWNLGWGGGGIQTRFFEAMGAGACVLTNTVENDTGTPFVSGKHLVSYSNAQEAVEQARKLLSDDRLRQSIADFGHIEVQKHSIDCRLLTMFIKAGFDSLG